MHLASIPGRRLKPKSLETPGLKSSLGQSRPGSRNHGQTPSRNYFKEFSVYH